MFQRFQGIVIGFCLCFLLTGIVVAKTGTETIEAVYNNIKIYVDGIKIEPKDGNGQSVEPFIYNGTTYLPVRAVGEAIGKDVSWDAQTQSVYLGQRQSQNWMDVCKPYEYKFGAECLSEKNKEFVIAGNTYTDGFTLDAQEYGRKAHALFNLNGEYSSLSFQVGHLDSNISRYGLNANLNIYLDGTLTETIPLIYDSGLQNITIALNRAQILKVEIEPEYSSYMWGRYGFTGGVFQ